ncbi:MAG: methyl-accepting chemotaxis protein, partial [Pseudomonadota bacterium]|nr:methyl-accepting chemotaxis protein [Pseudomonadota bacterium]
MNGPVPITLLSSADNSAWQEQSGPLRARKATALPAGGDAVDPPSFWSGGPVQRALPALPWIGHRSLGLQTAVFGGAGLLLLLASAALMLMARGSEMVLSMGLLLFVLAFLAIFALAYTCVVEARRQALASEAENQRNQAAIMRLLNEMGDLAEGDLTVRAQVTEDVTGAIADSMNFAVEELRNLVVGIDRGGRRLADKSATAYSMSGQMMLAAQRQSQGIQDAGQEVAHLVDSIRTVSSAAADAAGVARRALG